MVVFMQAMSQKMYKRNVKKICLRRTLCEDVASLMVGYLVKT